MDATPLTPSKASAFVFPAAFEEDASATNWPGDHDGDDGDGGEDEDEDEGRFFLLSSSSSSSFAPGGPALAAAGTTTTTRRSGSVFLTTGFFLLFMCYGITNYDCDAGLWTTTTATFAARRPPWSAATQEGGGGGGAGPGQVPTRGTKPPGGVRGSGTGTGTGVLNSTDAEPSEVVWLMTFPCSGTSYTIMNTERLSQRSTASNYAEDFPALAPVRPDLADDGPFLHDLRLPPAHRVLTKTHCGAYCVTCQPRGYVQSVDTFERECRSGSARDSRGGGEGGGGFAGGGGGARHTTYPPGVPAAAVHLVRNPFDNLVARMHLVAERAAGPAGSTRANPGGAAAADAAAAAAAVSPQEAMAAWCKGIDALHPALEQASDWIPANVQRAWRGLPCRSEWFRWVQWHNRAIEVTAQLQADRPGGFPVHLMYYEDYTFDYNATVQALFHFLDLDFRGSPVPFIPGKTYLNHFSPSEQRRAAQFVETTASPDCWAMVKHYFDGMLG